MFLIYRKDAFRRTWVITLLETLSVLKCVTSPLNANRLAGNFGGSTANSPIMAILLSFERTFLNIISWTDLKMLLLLLLLIPFLWKAVRKMEYSFRLPGLFTALSFGVYSSQATATIYRAYRMWRNGWAQAYGKGWEERIAVLKDESVKNPVFPPLNYVELLMYADLQPENGYVWVNSACAEYYGEESVTVTIGE